jgi:hypothetical protein
MESLEVTTDIRTIRLDELTEMLSPSLDENEVWAAVLEATEELNVFGYEISVEDALAVLDRMAGQPGLLGTSARFCRTRLMLLQH